MLKVVKLHEAGYDQAIFGLSLNKNQHEFLHVDDQWQRMERVAKKLAPADGGHNKFLEHIYMWLDVTAPRYWWQEADTYRVGNSKQSQSTMHTILDGRLTQDNFEQIIPEEYLSFLNRWYEEDDLLRLKAYLPEGFLQRREWVMNYKTFKNIRDQRSTHRLPHWPMFIEQVRSKLEHPELLYPGV